MKELVVEQVKITFCKAIKKFAKKSKIDKEDVSILLKLSKIDAVDERNEAADVRVLTPYVCHQHKVAYETEIKDIMGFTLTMSGIGGLVQAYIHTIIESFENEYKSEEIEITVYLDRADDEEVVYFVYVDGELKKQFLLIDVLKI